MRSQPYRLKNPKYLGVWCLLFAVAVGCDRREESASSSPPPVQSTESKLRGAFDLFQAGELDEAMSIVQAVLVGNPDDPIALRLAMDIEKQRQNFRDAGQLAIRAARANPSMKASLLVAAFDCHLRCAEFEQAEQNLRDALTAQPEASQVHRLLAQLLTAQGRRVEASRHVRELIRLRDIQPNELLSLIDLRGPFLLSSFQEFHRDLPISLFSLGEVRLQYASGREEIEPQLQTMERVIQAFPRSAAAAAFRCRMLADSGRHDELRASLEGLPTGMEDQPEYWFSVGTLLTHDGKNDEAIRAFSEAMRRDPTDRQSLRSIVDLLLEGGETDQAKLAQQRLSELDRVFRLAREANADDARWISKTLAAHSRPWEATAWLMQSAGIAGNLQSVIPELDRRHAAITAWEAKGTDQQRSSARLKQMLGFPPEDWPSPELDALAKNSTDSPERRVASDVGFANIAQQVGISTTFESGFPLDGKPFFPYQVNGGGLGILDYDLDGRTDIYMTQSGGDPQAEQGSVANQLYRMLPNDTFMDVSAKTKTGDRRYGQGVCVGDVNQDGFPDLLIANIGINTLYINQGDGSFREATQQLNDDAFRWTSSLGLADLDGDHLPEIVEVNYIDDADAYRITCTDNYLDCQPQRFKKCHDRVLRSNGDGTFSPWQVIHDRQPSAKLGFGLVIANFDRKFGNDFFISNDGDFNHYWVSTEADGKSDSKLDLVESASLYGCNIGRRGNSQACMGIAYGDFDRNGTLDLHVTNFLNEPVNLFLQSETGIFVDQVSKYGLLEPSYGVLGFGTQSVDFDNDGWLDIAVLNGHVYDGRSDEIPFRMKPQVMLGGPQGFQNRDATQTGEYWQAERLGRTLAMLDWNRDGRIDLLANHLDAPVALLQNNASAANWLQVELVGVDSERDAIGAEVRVTADGQTWHAWQTGGDGLMCTNESVLHFGVGLSETITRVEVSWPSGHQQSFSDLAPNQRILMIEGIDEPHRRD